MGQEAATEDQSMRELRPHEAGGTGKAELTQKEEPLRPGKRRSREKKMTIWTVVSTTAGTMNEDPENISRSHWGPLRRGVRRENEMRR